MSGAEPESPDPIRARLETALAGQYAIERELGGGGMSRVYMAEEISLGRKVVVKVLAPSLSSELSAERFAREIRLSARLQHPAIVPVLSSGVADGMPFYTMPWVAGESLRHRLNALPTGGRLSVEQSIAVLRDVARALAFAHGQGVIHRDIKPENVLLSADAAMVADFGVAKAVDAARSAAGHATLATLTRDGSSLGTPAYMSPEQAAGDPGLDARSDLYALGLVMYEMFAGAHPFAHRTTVRGLVTAHLAEEPRPLPEVAPDVPPGIAIVVMQCLAKVPDDRPASAAVVVDALTTRQDPVAPTARVTAAMSTAKGITGQRPRWLAAMVIVLAAVGGVSGLTWKLTSSSVEQTPSALVNSPAYDNYARGRVKVALENRQDNEDAIRYLRQAVATDPNLAPAWAALSRAYSIRAFYFAPDSEKRVLTEEAQLAADKALALNPDLAEGWFAKGLMLWTPGRRFPHDLAIAAYQRALALDPQLHEAHHQLALVLLHVGLLDEAWSHVDSALAVEPTNMLARFRYGVISSYQGNYVEADEFFRKTPIESNPSLWVFQAAHALFRLGQSDSAKSMITRFLAANPADEGGVGHSVLAMIEAKAGRRADADSAIAASVAQGRTFGHFHHTAFNIAVAETLLGRKAEAIRWLEIAADEGFPCYPYFAGDSVLAALASEPRFIALLERTRGEMNRYRAILKR
jgi:serine/threonine protein kinase/tetratricopeptide (TPR) repeat protein